MSENSYNKNGDLRELDEIRRELDKIDDEILELFIKRQNLVKEVARYKLANNVPIFRPGREDEILERVRSAAGDEYGDAAAGLFEELMKSSRNLQHRIADDAKKRLQQQ